MPCDPPAILGYWGSAASGTTPLSVSMRPYNTATGARRHQLTLTEKTSCALSQIVLCQSHSLREQAISDALCPASKIVVLGNGSNGVDANERFNPALHGASRERLRRAQGW